MTKQISLFVQCLVDAMFPEAAESMVKVFERIGVDVAYPPGQTCCGQPSFNAGYTKAARQAAEHFLDIFVENDKDIVCPSGSCVYMVRHHYPLLFKEYPERQQQAINIGKRCYEFTEYLVDILGIVELQAYYPKKVTYHDSCHLYRGLHIEKQPRELLSHVDGLNFIEMNESTSCCGFGGTFSVNYPEISTALVDRKIANVLATKAEVVCGCDVSCLMNIKGRLSRLNKNIEVLHIAEILAGDKQ